MEKCLGSRGRVLYFPYTRVRGMPYHVTSIEA